MASPSNSHFCESEMVKLVIGEEKKVFFVHRELICAHSDYFRACFEGEFAESQRESLELDDPLQAVTTFLDWLYKGTVTINREDLHYSILVPIYVFADRICSEEYINLLVDAIREAHEKFSLVVDIQSVIRLYDCGLRNSKATEFGLRSIVHDMVVYPGEWKNGKSREAVNCWSTNSDLMLDMQREFWRALEAKGNISPDLLEGCVFHQHAGGVTCAPKKRKRID